MNLHTNRYHALTILLLAAVPASSQLMPLSGYPFEVPADPRSIAMGESFVAVPANPGALLCNPAGLAGVEGITASYAHRGMDWVAMTDEWGLNSFTATVGLPFGVFAAQYNRESFWTLPVTTTQFPDGDGTTVHLYSYDVAIGFGSRLPNGLALGVTAKYYDFIQTVTGPSAGIIPSWSTTAAYLFDFGVNYTVPPFHTRETIDDSISLGLSFQNVGSRWKLHTPGNNAVGNVQGDVSTILPQFFRIGLSYALRVVPTDAGSLAPISAVLSGEFRSLQNPQQGFPGTAYWGAGLELTIFELLSLRGGAAFKPYDDFEGVRDEAGFRVGAGLNVPLRRISAQLPITLTFNYALISLNRLAFNSYLGGVKSTTSAFSLEARYLPTL